MHTQSSGWQKLFVLPLLQSCLLRDHVTFLAFLAIRQKLITLTALFDEFLRWLNNSVLPAKKERRPSTYDKILLLCTFHHILTANWARF